MRNVWCIEHGIVCLRFVIHIKYTACWLCNQWIPLGSMKLCAFLMYVFRFVKIPNAHEFVHHRFESTHWIQNLFALYRNPSIHIESRNWMRVCVCACERLFTFHLLDFFFSFLLQSNRLLLCQARDSRIKLSTGRLLPIMRIKAILLSLASFIRNAHRQTLNNTKCAKKNIMQTRLPRAFNKMIFIYIDSYGMHWIVCDASNKLWIEFIKKCVRKIAILNYNLWWLFCCVFIYK